jgi:hypothetical protein
MGELESIISVLGTLSGLLIGYWISSQSETRKQKHEKEMEYRREIMKHMDDIIKPLFFYLEDLWGSLATLQISLRQKSSIIKGKTLDDLISETKAAYQKLKQFTSSKYYEMSLLFPHSLSPWIFAPISELIEPKIFEQISKGKIPDDEITLAINTLMKIQKNLKRLVGFEIDVEMERVYPFTSSKENKGDTAEEKFGFALRAVELFLASIMGAFASKILEPYWSMPNLVSQLIAGTIAVIALLLYSALFYFVIYEGVQFGKRRIKRKDAKKLGSE